MALQNTLSFSRDTAGVPSYLRNQSPLIINGALVEGVAQSYTVPATINGNSYGAYHVVLGWSVGNNVYVSLSGTAVIPSGALAVGTTEANPVGYGTSIAPGTVISLITDGETVPVSLSFYGIPTNGGF